MAVMLSPEADLLLQKFDYQKHQIENGVFLGHIASLTLVGPWEMTSVCWSVHLMVLRVCAKAALTCYNPHYTRHLSAEKAAVYFQSCQLQAWTMEVWLSLEGWPSGYKVSQSMAHQELLHLASDVHSGMLVTQFSLAADQAICVHCIQH